MKLFPIRFLGGLCLLCAGLVSAAGVPAWYQGERLDFEVGYGFIDAGDANLISQVSAGDTNHLEFLTLAQNNGFFESVYPVKDTIFTKVRRFDLAPEYYRKVNHEGNYHDRSQILFDILGRKARLSDTIFADNHTVKRSTDSTVSLDGETHCIISAFYKVRTLNLEPGKEWHFYAVSGKKKYHLRVICHRRETISVLAGTFPCLVVEPVLDGDGIFQSKGSLTIWLSDDERRLPVLMKSKIAVGSIRAELKAWSQGSSALHP